MKKVLILVVLMLTLVRSQRDVYARKRGNTFGKPKPKPTPKPEHTPGLVTISSTEDALRDLTQEGKPIRDRDVNFLSPVCRTMDMSTSVIKDYGLHFVFDKTCYVVGLPSDNAILLLHVISKDIGVETIPGSEQCANMLKFQAVLLPFLVNKNTYMILDPERAPWFFTDRLGGCDIFVATAQNQGKSPLVIHSNRNLLDDQASNLQDKEKSVNNLLANIDGDYRIIARAYFLPTHPPQLVERVEVYINQYSQDHQGIKLLSYNNDFYEDKQFFYFFGHYVIEQQPARWRFYLKGEKDGSLSHFDVSQQGNLMK